MRRILGSTVLTVCTAFFMTGCDSPTESTTLEVTLTAEPSPSPAVASQGVTYQVVNADSTTTTYEYPWLTSFTVTIQETGGLAVDITALDLKVQQAAGGIVITPSGGSVEHYKFTSSASGNHINAKGSASVGFNVWYDLPNKGKEALVTVYFSFKDADNNVYSESAQVRVAP